MNTRNTLAALSIAVLLTLCVGTTAQNSNGTQNAQIVFVCEHGAAMSVIAAAYFNKQAAEHGLQERAIYRGVTPQEDLSVPTLKGLQDDGFTAPTAKPSLLTSQDVNGATHIFSVGCTLPSEVAANGKTEVWSDVPKVSEGYAVSREAIKRHVEQLVGRLQKP